jgi:glutamate dehydrogenase/leucine dehydrogenase
VPAIAAAAGGVINSADNVYTYNSSGNWTVGSLIAVTAILTAEL